MDATPTKSKILPLTSIRFFAALYVVLFHASVGIQNSLTGVVARIVGLGYVSVSFFFLLSGFILALVYLKDDRPVDKRKFYVARFARIYPLYLAATFLDFPHYVHVARSMDHRSWGHIGAVFLTTAGLVQAWFLNLKGINGPGWSLSVEAFFYLLFPFLGTAVWRMRPKVMWPFAILVYCGGTLLVKVLSDSNISLDRQSESPLEHFYIFILGICLAKLFVWIGADEDRSIALQRWAPWLLLIAVVSFLVLPILDLQVSVMLLQHGIQSPIFALVLLAFASGERTIAGMFSAKWLVILGEASFALYLIHVPVYMILRRWIEGDGIAGLLLYLGVSIGLSVASIYWLEIPARRWILQSAHVRSMETTVTSSLAQ